MSKLFNDETKPVPKEVEIQGKQLACSVCNCKTFWEFKTILNQETQSVLDIEFLSKKTKSYICSECRLKLEFLEK